MWSQPKMCWCESKRLQVFSRGTNTLIDLTNEDLLSLPQAAKLCPRRRGGKQPHVSCLYRWTRQGCRGVRLEWLQVGGTRCTTRQALQRFFRRLTENAKGEAPAATIEMPPSPEIAAALDAEGICQPAQRVSRLDSRARSATAGSDKHPSRSSLRASSYGCGPMK